LKLWSIDKLLRKNTYLSVAFRRTVAILKEKPEAGQLIRQQQWPRKLKREYNLKNLYRYDIIRKHPGWKLLYTITPDGKIKILVVVLKVLGHHKYDRLFKY